MAVSKYYPRIRARGDDGKPLRDPETGKVVYTRAEKHVWHATYRDGQGKQHAKNFKTKGAAEIWLTEVNVSVATGTYVDPKQARTLVSTIAGAWLAGHPDWTESTRVRNSSIMTRHILPRWGTTKVGDLAHDALQEWITELSGQLAGGTVRKIAGVLSGVLDEAVITKRLAVNPMGTVKLPKQRLTKRRYLSAHQVERFAEAAGVHGDVVLVLAYCGLRIGELAALKVGHVDLLRKRLRIEESVTEVNGALAWSAPKDHQRRSVPFPGFLVEPIGARLHQRSPEDLLFPSARGGALRVRNLRRDWFDAAATAVGVEGLTPHELRHTAASLAVSVGANVLAVQRMLGHDKPSTTLDLYSDLFDEDLDAVADRLHEARSAILLTPC